MQFNAFVFPSPRPSYTHSELYGNLIYIPKDTAQWAITAPFVSFHLSGSVRNKESVLSCYGAFKAPCIPCLFLPAKHPTNKILIHFHGNAEDVGLTRDLLKLLRKELRVHVLAMEYRGYGVYTGSPTEGSLLQDAELLYLYVTTVFRFAPQNVILFGRSIGSGPACYLASKYPLHSLILMSAFTSLREVVKGFVGPLLQYLVAERFDNKEWLRTAQCPVFVVHGKKDGIVPPAHAEELCSVVKSSAKLHTPMEMDHNSFSFMQDFVYPLLMFYEEQGLSMYYRLKNSAGDKAEGSEAKLCIPIRAFNRPN